MRILFPYMARWKAVNWTRYHSLFSALADMGHEIIVLQTPPSDLKETNFQEIEVDIPANIHLIDVHINQKLWNLNLPLNKLYKKALYSLACWNNIRKLIREQSIDALFLYNIPQYPLINVRDCLRIFDIADDYVAMLGHELGKLGSPLILNIADKLLRNMIRKSDLVLSVSNVLAKQLNSGAEVLPNGVDLEKLSQCGKELVSLPLPKPVVGFVGAFEYFIDFEMIVDTIELLPECTFLLVGAGREWDRVVQQVRARNLRNVHFTGGVPHSQVFAYVNIMDVCLNIFKKIPVSHGACPIKLFEYLGMKKPVVSTRLDELAYVDRDFIYFADTSPEAASKIKEILADPVTAQKRISFGYNEVQTHYTWQNVAKRFESLVKNKFN